MRLWIFFIYLVQWSLATSCGRDHYVKDKYIQTNSGICSENGFQRILLDDKDQCLEVEVANGQTPVDGQLPHGACLTGIEHSATFCIDPNEPTCTECPEGKIQLLAGSDKCDMCPVGTYQTGSLGARSCDDCPKGYSQNETEKIKCKQCLEGQLQPLTGSDDCDQCPVGTYQIGTLGERECDECPEGWFQDNNGQTLCKGCVPGTFQNENGQPYCNDCERGQYQDTPTNIRCLSCQPGTFTIISKQETCVSCPQGWFQTSSNGRSCERCPSGKTTNGTTNGKGNTECHICAKNNCVNCPGYGMNSDTCGPCAFNEYSIDTHDCKTCPVGWAAVEESSKCEQCSQEQEATKLGTCQDCQVGGFRPSINGSLSDKCTNCQNGHFFGPVTPWTTKIQARGDNITEPSAPLQADCYETAIAHWRTYGGLPDTNNYMPLNWTNQDVEESTFPQGCLMVRHDGINIVLYNAKENGRGQRWSENNPGYRMINTVVMPNDKDICRDYAIKQFAELDNATTIVSINDPNLPYGCWKPPADLIQGQYKDKTYAIWVQTDGYCPQPQKEMCRYAGMEIEKQGFYNFVIGSDIQDHSVVADASPGGCVAEEKSRYFSYLMLAMQWVRQGNPTCSEKYKCICVVMVEKADTITTIVTEMNNSNSTIVFNTNKANKTSIGGFEIITGPPPMGGCLQCPKGYYNGDGSVDCRGCEPGQFAANDGQTKCDDCPFPKKSFWASETCVDVCQPPFDVDHWGDSNCKYCPSGKYSACLADSTQCNSSCLADSTQCNKTLEDECTDCTDGKVRKKLWNNYCENCPPGKIANNNKTECVGCPPGKYEDAGVCEECRTGQFISMEDAQYPVKCELCTPGQYQDKDGMQNCTKCARGQFSNNNGLKECVDCPTGYYSNKSESIGCVACLPGKSSTDGKTCQNCTGSKIEIDHKCQYCPSGKFFEDNSCHNCQLGYFVDSMATSATARRKCTICPSGWAQDKEGIPLSYRGGVDADMSSEEFKNRTEAEAGDSSKRGVASYFSVNTIKWSVIQSTKNIKQDTSSKYTIYRTSSCFECEQDEVTNLFEAGSSFCLECTTGEVCQECSSGRYFNTECTNCPRGYISAQGTSVCNTCPAGQREIDHTGCDFCPLGEQPKPLSGNVTDDHNCEDCPVGYFGSSKGVCIACPRGFYQTDTQQQACTICPDLQTTDGPKKTSADDCKTCAAAFTLVIDGICSTCPAGRITGSFKGCEDCPPGKHRRSSNTICEDCAIGKFSNSKSPCATCETGKYTDRPGQSVCEDCHEGITTNTCEGCPAGKWGNPKTMPGCKECPIGYWSLAGSDDSCSMCGIGRANPETVQKICPSCLPGKYADELGSTTCKDCPTGHFQENKLAGVCIKCRIGTYQDIPGSLVCTNCQPGTYTVHIAASSAAACIDCPAGYMEVEGVCHICPERSYQPFAKSTNCEACPDETISTRGSVSSKDCFSTEGMKSYVFGMKGDSKPPQSASKKCEIRPNLVMLCPGCSCNDDSRNGFWAGPICDECRRGFATTSCLAKCPAYDGTHDSTMCNGNGFCWYGKYGNGLCYCGSKHAIDSSGENVVVDVRLCPKGQICPNYGLQEQIQTNYRPLYYIMRYRQFSVFVLQLNKYVPVRGHMWFKRFPPSIAYENTCLHCAVAYSQDISTSVGFWKNDGDYEYFEDTQQALTGFHGENCQHQCGLCLNGGRCSHAPHPYRYSYTIKDSFENPRENVFIPQTICICSSLVFDSENMCCPNGFQPYIHYGLRKNPKPYTRFSHVPFITNIKNLKMPHWINKDILLEQDEKYMTPYTEPSDGKIWVANNNKQWSTEEKDFVQVPYRDAGPYNKHTYYGVPKEMCRACPGLFGKGVRSGTVIIESEQEAEDKWWDNAMGASARKCNGIGVCDFYKRENELKTDFFGNADLYIMFERGKVCSDPNYIQMHNVANGQNVSPETLNTLCAELARKEQADWYAVSAPYFGGNKEDMRTDIDDDLIVYYNRNVAEEVASTVNSRGIASFENGTDILWTILDHDARKLPIPSSDSNFTIYALGTNTCGIYTECLTYVDVPNFNIYKREYGRGDDRLSIQNGDTVDATFDRFDTCFTYTKNQNIQTYGLYITRDYEQGEDPFLGGYCPKGHFCTKHEKIAYKEDCPPGYYQPDQGRTRTVPGNKCNELSTLEDGCKSNEATLIATDFVDQVCLRCPRNYWSPKGGAVCTECPFGKVKKISGIFDQSTVMINMAYITNGILPWYYHPNEIGLELADCALVPQGIVHIPYINDHMTYEKQDFLAVAQCPFGFSSRPGSFIYEGFEDMANMIKNSEVSIIEAPFIKFKQSWTFSTTEYGETCKCNTMDILTEEQCIQALKNRGIDTMFTRYGPAGCYLLASTPLVGYYGRQARSERPVRSIRYLCRLGNSNKGFQSKFALSNCFRCPGNSISGPISTTCTTCFANKLKFFAKTAIQKLIESSLIEIIRKDAKGNDLGYDSTGNSCICTDADCSCNKIAYRTTIQNHNLVYEKSANFEIIYTFGQFGGDMPLELSDCYLMCQSQGVSSPILITGVGISTPDMTRCYCSTGKNTNNGEEEDNIIWYIVEGTKQFKRNGITLPIETQPGRTLKGVKASVYADTSSPPEANCKKAGQAMMIAQGIRIPDETMETLSDLYYPSGCFIMEVDGTYFTKWNNAGTRNVGDDKTVKLVKQIATLDANMCLSTVESWRNSAYPTVEYNNGETINDGTRPSDCFAELIFEHVHGSCKDSGHKITSSKECTQLSQNHGILFIMNATDSYIQKDNETCGVHDYGRYRRTITTAEECRRAGESVSNGAIKFHTDKKYYNVWNAQCPEGRVITTAEECRRAGEEVFGETPRNNYDLPVTNAPYGCGYKGPSDNYDIHLNSNEDSTTTTYPTNWLAYKGSLCKGDGLFVPYGCGYSNTSIHWNPNKGTVQTTDWWKSRGAICGGERQGLPYGCSFLPSKVTVWNPNVASAASLPDDWSSFCLKKIMGGWNIANGITTAIVGFLPISTVNGEGCVEDKMHSVEACIKKCVDATDCESVSVYTNGVHKGKCCFWASRWQEEEYVTLGKKDCGPDKGVINSAQECEDAGIFLDLAGTFEILPISSSAQSTLPPFGCSHMGVLQGNQYAVKGVVFNPNPSGHQVASANAIYNAICHNYLDLDSDAVWFDLKNIRQTLPSSIQYMEDINSRALSDGCMVMSKESCKALCNKDHQCKAVKIFTAGENIGNCCFVKSWTEPSPGDINKDVEFYISEEILLWSFTAWEEQGLPLCSSCNPGSFTQNGKCQACELGKFTSTMAAAATEECATCGPGFFARKRGSITCIGCPEGWYQDQPKSGKCIKCAVGRAQKNIGSVSCGICEAGKYAGMKAPSCTGCAEGKYAEQSGSEKCEICDGGTFGTGTSQTTCTDCPKGFQQGSPTTCQKCTAGKYAAGPKTPSCTSCQVGQFAIDPGRYTGCDRCTVGKYTDNIGSKSCKSCPGGKSCKESGDLQLCARGRYKQPKKFGDCDICPAGKFTPKEGAVKGCQWCPGGKYTLGSGEETCTWCPEEGFDVQEVTAGSTTWNNGHSLDLLSGVTKSITTTYVVAPVDGAFAIKVVSIGLLDAYFHYLLYYIVPDTTTSILIWDKDGQTIGGIGKKTSTWDPVFLSTTLYLKKGQRARIQVVTPAAYYRYTREHYRIDVDQRLYNFVRDPKTSYCGASNMIKSGESISTDYSCATVNIHNSVRCLLADVFDDLADVLANAMKAALRI